jgi:geranylgeranyl pyrophosphate synthase
VISPVIGALAPIAADLAAVERRLEAVSRVKHPLLRGIVEETLATAGPRLRAAATVASARLFGEATANVVNMAAAIELVHAALLLHGDVADQNGDGRGRRVVANAVTILVGDYLLAQAAVAATDVDNLRVMHLFTDAIQTVCAGRIHARMHTADGVVESGNRAPTAFGPGPSAALFELACQTGAILGEATLAQTEALRRCGASLGLAFQHAQAAEHRDGCGHREAQAIAADVAQALEVVPPGVMRDLLAGLRLHVAEGGV